MPAYVNQFKKIKKLASPNEFIVFASARPEHPFSLLDLGMAVEEPTEPGPRWIWQTCTRRRGVEPQAA
jgi:hypothetical protein